VGRFLHAFFSPLGLRRAVPQVWDGFQTNIKMMLIAEALVLVFALLVALIRGLPGRSAFPLRAIAIGYTDFFRGTPLILVAYVFGLGLPALNLALISNRSLVFYGILSLTVVYTAYVTEVYRAGIESVHPSQRMAARSHRPASTRTTSSRTRATWSPRSSSSSSRSRSHASPTI
jgi:polar amino acid transport system permease protein